MNWGDWLGTGVIATRERRYRPFHEARTFARSLGLLARSTRSARSEWWAYLKKSGIPKDIPARPDHVYAKKGWAGWNDWLGTESVSSRQRPEASVPALAD